MHSEANEAIARASADIFQEGGGK